MFKYLNCISVAQRLEAEAAEDGVIAPATKTVAETTTDNQISAIDSTTNESTSASASAFPSSASDTLAHEHLATLPQATTHIGITFRLFASTGKLLAHFEDDLELFPSNVGPAGSSVIRDPITFHLPMDKILVEFPGDDKLVQQRHRNNSFFDRSPRQRRGANTHIAALASLDSATTTRTLTLHSVGTVRAAGAQSDKICCYYYGSVCALLCELPPPLPSPSSKKKAAPAALGNISVNNRLCRCDPKSGRRFIANRSVLSSSALLEPDGMSGRTVHIGCVPSVPVARSRLVTHKTGLKMSYMYSG